MDFESLGPKAHLYLSLGIFTATWGHAEYALDMCIAVLFHEYGGQAIAKKIPRPLESRVDFLRQCYIMRIELLSFKEDGITIADKFSSLSDERHTLIHGINIEDIEDGSFKISRIRYEKYIHREETSFITPARIMTLVSSAQELTGVTLTHCERLLQPIKLRKKI